MSDIKKKVLDIISSPQLMSFATITEDGKPWVRYVIGMADDNLTIRFSTFVKSRKVAQIEKNQEVHGLKMSKVASSHCMWCIEFRDSRTLSANPGQGGDY